MCKREVKYKKLNLVRKPENGSLEDIASGLVQNAWDTFTKYRLLGPLHDVIEPYMWLDRAVLKLLALLRRSERLVSLKQKDLFQSWSPLLILDEADTIAQHGLAKVHEEI